MVQPCQVKCSQPCQAKVRFGVGERSTNDDIRTDFFLFLFLFFFLSLFGLSVLYTIIHFFISPFFGEFQPVIVNWWWWMWFFFSVHLHRSDPTEWWPHEWSLWTTNQHSLFCSGLCCGLLMMMKRTYALLDTRELWRNIRHFRREDWFIYRHLCLRLRHLLRHHHHFGKNTHGFMWFRDWWGKRISSIRNGSLISKVCQVVFSLMSKMRRIHGYIVAFPFVLAREGKERERDNDANKKMIQMNDRA